VGRRLSAAPAICISAAFVTCPTSCRGGALDKLVDPDDGRRGSLAAVLIATVEATFARAALLNSSRRLSHYRTIASLSTRASVIVLPLLELKECRARGLARALPKDCSRMLLCL
jgi:hypothetical protein